MHRNQRREAREAKRGYYRVQGEWEGGGFGYTIPAADEAEARAWGEHKARFHRDAEITVIPRGPVENAAAVPAPVLHRFLVTPTCGGRQVAPSYEVMGTDKMAVAAREKAACGVMAWGSHPRVTALGEAPATEPEPFTEEARLAADVARMERRSSGVEERDWLHGAIQDETQAALGREW